VDEGQNAPPPVLTSSDWHYGDEVLVEHYVAGRELTCAVLDGCALDVCEIVPEKGAQFYDYQAKYAKGGSKHICPAEILPNIYQTVQIMAENAHKALGCRGVSRSDFRYDDREGRLVWLEINTQPGMTETSLVPDVAKIAGLDFTSLVRWMIEDASCLR